MINQFEGEANRKEQKQEEDQVQEEDHHQAVQAKQEQKRGRAAQVCVRKT